MLSVVIPTLNAAPELGRTLSALVPAAIDGLVHEVVVADGGSSDETAAIAEAAGAHFILAAPQGRGQQLQQGAAAAKEKWLLFLHADTVLEPGWEQEVQDHIHQVESGMQPQKAAVFRFSLNDTGLMPRLLESLVSLRCWLFGLPYGDQGLVISRALYDEAGGFRPLPLMEDVDFMRRLGRRRVTMLNARAITSARRYRQEGYLKRMLRNLSCLMLYYLKVPPRMIVKLYG